MTQESNKTELPIEEKTILIIDSDYINRVCLAVYLSDYNCAVFLAKNGIEAIQTLSYRNNSIDLIIVEITVEDFEISELIKMLKERCGNVPVIVQSKLTTPLDVQKCYSCGCDDFIPKPIYIDNLLNTLDPFLSRLNISKKETVLDAEEEEV